MIEDFRATHKIPGRADPISPADNAERLRKIHTKSQRMTYNPDDSRVDYDDPAFRAVAPHDWTRRHG